jgi:outer membrane protein assembly factor BamD (BamD/ComL family)
MAYAQQLAPDDIEVNLNYAYHLKEMDQPALAAEILDNFLQKYPTAAEVAYCLCGLQLALGKKQSALRSLEQALIHNYEGHEKLFHYFPQLKNNPLILRTITGFDNLNS